MDCPRGTPSEQSRKQVGKGVWSPGRKRGVFKRYRTGGGSLRAFGHQSDNQSHKMTEPLVGSGVGVLALKSQWRTSNMQICGERPKPVSS